MASLLNRVYDAVRHPSADLAGSQAATITGFEHLRGHKYCLLVTYKRSGDPVPTPVWFGLRDGKVFVRTEADVAKVRRIRNDARVRLAPCDARGKPLGAPAEGSARILDHPGAEERDAEAALKANYGLGRRIYERLDVVFGAELVYIEIAPASAPPAGAPPSSGA